MYTEDRKVVLFDGTNTDEWQMADGSPCTWQIENGELVVGQGKGNIVSRKEYGDALIHVEFKCADMPECTGQAKSNSGVYVHGQYEIQVLDSYGLDTSCWDCGALYGLYEPLVNACLPAEKWQCYDIIFRAPRLNENGMPVAPAYITVFQNKMLIHNNRVLYAPTGGPLRERISAVGPLMLQDHGDRVCYRNIWYIPLDEK